MSTDEATYKEAYDVVKKRLREVLEENEMLRSRLKPVAHKNRISADALERLVKDLQVENNNLIRERGDLQDAVMKRDDTIDIYRKWFRDHEHLIKRDDREIKTQKDIFRDFL